MNYIVSQLEEDPVPHSLIYAGIGSRNTPVDAQKIMLQAAYHLAQLGYTLRSGAAEGADSAFELGAKKGEGKTEIWLPWTGFNQHADTGFYPSPKHFEMAAIVHPAWERLSRGARALHARNAGQILGKDIASPVDFVICWTPDGCSSEKERSVKTGGTGTAIAIADRHGIPVWNINSEKGVDSLLAFWAHQRANGYQPNPSI